MFLEELFATVLRMSFYGTIGCGVVLVCVLVNYVRAPRWISMALWGLVALRLLVPLSFSSALSFFQVRGLSDRIEDALDFEGTYSGDYKIALEGSALYEEAVAAGSPVERGNNGDHMAYYYERKNGRIEPAKTAYQTFLPAAARVWIAGTAALWFWALVSYIRLNYRLRFSMRLMKGVYETDAVASPCVVGILRPRIYLIPGLSRQQRMHILLHERMHIRYLDPVWKLISFFVISVHWFNPFLWGIYRLFQGELEKACDERVLARLGEDRKADYGETLLALSTGRKRRMPTPIAFGENDIRDRIKRILAYRKPLAVVSVIVVIAAITACAVFLTMPRRASEAVPEERDFSSLAGDAPLPENSGDAAKNPQKDSGADAKNVPDATVPDTEPGPDLAEVYGEINDNDVIYQARWDGIYRSIYRAAEAGQQEERIYEGFAGTNPMMTVFEGRLYFKTDKLYQEGALDWGDNTIRWIDLETLATGDLSLVREDALISEFYIYDGLIQIWYAYPDIVDYEMLYADEDTVGGRHITQLSEQEKDLLGAQTRASLIQNPGTLVNISNRVRNQNRAYLDMDGDGKAEEIILEPSDNPIDDSHPLREYRLRIGEGVTERSGYNPANILWAVSLDGREILLVLYDDGPSADPETYFFRYQNGRIGEAGRFEEDIRLCEISPAGIITGGLRREIVQTDWITVQWRMNESGMLEEIPQEVYEFRNGNWVTLNEELPLHPERESGQTFSVQPQMVRFLQTSADGRWVLVETEDGRRGWVWIDENYEVKELHKNVMDVFDGIYLAG